MKTIAICAVNVLPDVLQGQLNRRILMKICVIFATIAYQMKFVKKVPLKLSDLLQKSIRVNVWYAVPV